MMGIVVMSNLLAALKEAGAEVPGSLVGVGHVACTPLSPTSSEVLLGCTYSNGQVKTCRVSFPLSASLLHEAFNTGMGGLWTPHPDDHLPILSREDFEFRASAAASPVEGRW